MLRISTLPLPWLKYRHVGHAQNRTYYQILLFGETCK